MKYVGILLLSGGIFAATLLVIAPLAPYAGQLHTPHEREQRLLLRSGEKIGQTFRMEARSLSRVAIWVDTAKPLPASGDIELDVELGARKARAVYSVKNIPPSGVVVFSFEKPIIGRLGQEGQYMIGISSAKESLSLKFEIDAQKYPEGKLVYGSSTKQGDLAFQLFYYRPALGSVGKQWGYAAILLGCAVALWATLKKYPQIGRSFHKKDIVLGLAVGCAVAIFYSLLLVRPGFWLGPTDFTKDASYIASGAQALRQGVWPIWHHATCGGLPLMGNVEGNILSIGTLFALGGNSQMALMLTNSIEAGIAAAGVYALARFFKSSRMGAVAASAIYALSPVYMFKISVGYSMLGALFALAPWVLLFFGSALLKRSAHAAILAGLLLGAIVLRGEAHVVIILVLLIALWALYVSVISRRMYPIVLLLACASMAFFTSSIKLLPYIEYIGHEKISLKPYVAPLLQNNLLVESLLTVQPNHESVPVLHGKFGEVWGAFGSYVGVVPIVLAVIGMFAWKKEYRVMIILAVCSFLLAEGTLFEYVLRFVFPLDALLRLPARNMMLVVLCIALFASRGLDAIAENISMRWVRYVIIGSIIAWVVFDMGSATMSVVKASIIYTNIPPAQKLDRTTFMNYAVNAEQGKNANVLLAHGYMLPQVCADQDRTVSFIKDIQDGTSLASVPASLVPNGIVLMVPPGTQDVTVRERFTSLWVSSGASLLPAYDGSLHVIARNATGGEIVVKQVSPTHYVQQVLFVTIVLYLTHLLLYEKVRVWIGRKK